MTITAEDALRSMISGEIESESVTDATASARAIVITVKDEEARLGTTREREDVELPGESDPSEQPEEPGPEQPEPGPDDQD